MSTEPWNASDGAALPAKDVSKRWQRIFSKFDEGRSGLFAWSIIGFFVGPLYYMYLRMWRKAFAILAAIFLLITISSIIKQSTGSNLDSWVGLLIGAFCATRVKKDFYKLHRTGEKMWPILKPVDHGGYLAAVIVGSLVIGALAFQDDSRSIAFTTPRAKTGAAESPAWVPHQTPYELNNALAFKAGISGASCNIGWITLVNQTFNLRAANVPVDQATEGVFNERDGLTYRTFMLESVRGLYSDPDGMRRILDDGTWMRKCITTVRGF